MVKGGGGGGGLSRFNPSTQVLVVMLIEDVYSLRPSVNQGLVFPSSCWSLNDGRNARPVYQTPSQTRLMAISPLSVIQSNKIVGHFLLCQSFSQRLLVIFSFASHSAKDCWSFSPLPAIQPKIVGHFLLCQSSSQTILLVIFSFASHPVKHDCWSFSPLPVIQPKIVSHFLLCQSSSQTRLLVIFSFASRPAKQDCWSFSPLPVIQPNKDC